MKEIAVKFFVKSVDNDSWGIINTGEFVIDKWDAYKLFTKLYEHSYNEPCDITKKEFEKMYEVVGAGDVIVIGDVDGVEETAFIRV
jgi:hypothetical protein